MQKIRQTIQIGILYSMTLLLVGIYPLSTMASATADPVEVEAVTTATEQVTPTQEQVSEPEPGVAAPIDGVAVSPPAETRQVNPQPEVTPEQAAQVDTAQLEQAASQQSAQVTSDLLIDTLTQSDAVSGDAAVIDNTNAGSATTGDAAALATVINNISSTVAGQGEIATFVRDIVGDVHGDIMLYPMLLQALLDSTSKPVESALNTSVNTTINNDINLNATSGHAKVAQNTNAGDATTGTANAVANVMNLINSVIAANQSFIGTINIHGNFDGDILIAPDFLPEMLANNNQVSGGAASASQVSIDGSQSIVNNLALTATSGNATVADNTRAGSATTGTAKTNVVLLNMTGHEVVASNSLLVFVNVLGQWVGLIVDAPAGATAAVLGNGVTSSTPRNGTQAVDATNSSLIVNNINLNARSGDADVTGNTTAGSATTGAATASANIANISNSAFGLSGWFGVLFINVFGSWNGSFGVDTASGGSSTVTPPKPPVAEGGDPKVAEEAKSTSENPGIQAFKFVASNFGGSSSALTGQSSGDGMAQVVATDESEKEEPSVLAASTGDDSRSSVSSVAQSSMLGLLLPISLSLVGIGLGLMGARNVIDRFTRRDEITL